MVYYRLSPILNAPRTYVVLLLVTLSCLYTLLFPTPSYISLSLNRLVIFILSCHILTPSSHPNSVSDYARILTYHATLFGNRFLSLHIRPPSVPCFHASLHAALANDVVLYSQLPVDFGLIYFVPANSVYIAQLHDSASFALRRTWATYN